MDHVQLPAGGLEPIEVPFVASTAFDCDDFESFPARSGFPPVDDYGGWAAVPSEKTAAFVQSWLFFGLMSAFLGKEMEIDGFIIVKKDPQKPLVTSALLLPLLDDWLASAVRDDADEQDRLMALLKTSAAALSRFSSFPQANVAPLPEVLLSAFLLFETLATTVASLGPDGPTPTTWQLNPNTIDQDAAAQLLARNLRAAGWCPWKIQQILSQYTYLTIYYISRLRDPIAPHVTHSSCTKHRCIGNNVDMNNYVTRHTEPSCACQHSTIPEDKLRSIISDGDIPIARIKLSTGGDPYLEIDRAGPETHYVAISHVWSDGLGNPHANSLPRCQLKRLHDSVELLAPPMFDLAQGYINLPQLNIAYDGKRMANVKDSTEWFWLDTLCIPIGADDQSMALKLQAINQMAAIYAGAHQVFVLDSVMQSSTIAGRTVCHVLAQLSAVAWLGRCWTYQEGALASSLQVQCADCSFDPAILSSVVEDSDLDLDDDVFALLPGNTTSGRSWYRIRRGLSFAIDMVVSFLRTPKLQLSSVIRVSSRKPTTAANLIAKHVYRQLRTCVGREMRYDRRGLFPLAARPSDMKDFVMCWNALAQRTTTMVQDVHIIIANLLRLNAFSILEMKSPEERMWSILWSLPAIPLSILFNKSKERVRPTEQHANRWMPLWPDVYTLDEAPTLQVQGDVLTLSTEDICEEYNKPKLLVLKRPLSTDGNSNDVLIVNTSGPQLEGYRVVLHRQPGDRFDSRGSHSTVIVLAPEGPDSDLAKPAQFSAACLHVDAVACKVQAEDTKTADLSSSHDADSEARLLATFDCPATVYSMIRLPPEGTFPGWYSATSPTTYTLSIRHDVPSTTQPLPQRPKNPTFMVMTVLILSISLPFKLLTGAMAILVLYQTIAFWATITWQVQVAAIFTIVLNLLSLPLDVLLLPLQRLVDPSILTFFARQLVPFAVGVVYVVLKAVGMETMGQLDKVIIALLVIGHIPRIVIASLARWYISPRVYQAWLETHRPDWEPRKTSWKLKAVIAVTESVLERFRFALLWLLGMDRFYGR